MYYAGIRVDIINSFLNCNVSNFPNGRVEAEKRSDIDDWGSRHIIISSIQKYKQETGD